MNYNNKNILFTVFILEIKNNNNVMDYHTIVYMNHSEEVLFAKNLLNENYSNNDLNFNKLCNLISNYIANYISFNNLLAKKLITENLASELFPLHVDLNTEYYLEQNSIITNQDYILFINVTCFGGEVINQNQNLCPAQFLDAKYDLNFISELDNNKFNLFNRVKNSVENIKLPQNYSVDWNELQMPFRLFISDLINKGMNNNWPYLDSKSIDLF